MIRVLSNHFSKPFAVLLSGEALLFLVAYYAGIFFRWANFHDFTSVVSTHLGQALVYTFVLVSTIFAVGLYDGRYALRSVDVLSRIVVGLAISFVVFSVIFYVWPSLTVWRSALAISLGVSLAGFLLLRYAFVNIIDNDLLKRRVLVVGTGEHAAQIDALERSGSAYGFNCVGFLDIGTGPPKVAPMRIIAKTRSLVELVDEYNVNEIVVALSDRRGQAPLDDLLDCKLSGTPILDYNTFLERETGSVDLEALRPSWFIFSDGFPGGNLQQLVKRAFDIVVSIICLILFMPLMAATAIAICIESGLPVFYRQERVGQNGRTFKIIKFRSMHVNAEADGEAVWAAKNDPRTTVLGAVIRKIRIDETPQILNVLRGEMSFVGPRPERPEFVAELTESIPYYNERHRVKPGITGWAQLNYIYGASVEGARKKLQYDLYYIKHYSILIDVFIVLQTVRVILWPVGVR
ncbi:MAG: TIGR03013 family PEP-CTERM/XrtA system glycosyltransferase [Kiloniellales bacterium]|nr:TIGR03013 family PEP-CTERM/XrtA system glycosyltransferase [Kiloniellales bacterium]